MKRITYLSLLLSASSAFAGDPPTITSLVLEGDTVPGVGLVTTIENIAINNSGSWLVEADTNFADTNQDSVLLRDNVLFLREGFGGLDFPAAVTIDSFDSVSLNNAGNGGFNFFLDPLPLNADSGVYINNNLVIQESDISTSPGLTDGTPYIGFFDVKINNNDNLMIVASIDDPSIASTVDRAIMLVDTLTGTETVIAKEGDVLPGQTEVVADFGTGPHESAVNDMGEVLYFADLTGDTALDGAVYLNQILLAQEGSASPIAGRNFEILSGRGKDLNNAGGHVFKANLTGDTANDEVLIVNGAVFKQEGDAAPGGFAFTNFGLSSGPILIDDSGTVLWFGEWNDPNGDINSGLFLNNDLIVQEGISTVAGVVMDTIASGTDAFSISDNGQWIAFEGTLDGGINGAFAINLGGVLLGDVNLDNVVSLLDVSPFVDLLTGGGFQAEADINGDGVVSLLDVSPFVALLTGP